jgi:hypothetical protein
MRGVGRASAIFALGLGLLAAAPARARDELDRYLATLQRQIDDPSRPIAERQRLALEAASALDRAAQDGRDAPAARAAWDRAATLLETFAAPPGTPGVEALRLQAAIYRWAGARTDFAVAERNPADRAARDAAARGLDAVVAALRPLADAPDARIAAEAGYRLAQALADPAARAEALTRLPEPEPALPGLAGHAARLRAELLLDLGRPAEAVEAAQRAGDAEPRAELAGLRARALAALGRLDEARAAVAAAAPAGAARDALLLPALLAAPDRATVAREALGLAAGLEGVAGRRARIAAARALAGSGAGLPVAQRATLAEGLALLGRPKDAAAELEAAADGDTVGDDAGRGRLRYRAALLRREAGDRAGARRDLDAILDRPGARDLHPRALLALAVLNPDAAPDADALRRLIDRHPDSEPADEARLLLGRALADELRDDEALALWAAIPPDRPRHADALDARLGLLLADLETARAVGAGDVPARRDRVASLLNGADPGDARTVANRTVQFARLRLKLIEWMDYGKRAEGDVDSDLERVGRLPLSPADRERLEVLRAGWLVRAGRHAEGGRLARSRFGGLGDAALLDGGESLERIAAASPRDVERRRLGDLCGEAAAAVLGRGPAGLDRVRAVLLASRAAGHRGDPAAAARALDGLGVEPGRLPSRARLDLAETRLRTGRADAALADYDAVARQAAPGSASWREARLGAARCHLAAGRPAAARRVVEATAVLDPDLGGPGMRPRFEAVRRRADRPVNSSSGRSS